MGIKKFNQKRNGNIGKECNIQDIRLQEQMKEHIMYFWWNLKVGIKKEKNWWSKLIQCIEEEYGEN